MSRGVCEKRFVTREGEPYLKDGITIRCQAVSRTKLRAIRDREDNPDLTPDDVFKEAQCFYGAVPGTYMCHYHGGESPDAQKNRLIMHDLMPGEMRHKMELLQNNTDYISRQEEILQLLAMNATLWEEMSVGGGGGPETWAQVEDGIRMIKSGDVVAGIALIEKARRSRNLTAEARNEVRENMKLLKDMTRTQVQTAQVLNQMATMEQVQSLVEGTFQKVQLALETYLTPEFVENNSLAAVKRNIISDIATGLRQLIGAGHTPIIRQVRSGDEEDDIS